MVLGFLGDFLDTHEVTDLAAFLVTCLDFLARVTFVFDDTALTAFFTALFFRVPDFVLVTDTIFFVAISKPLYFKSLQS